MLLHQAAVRTIRARSPLSPLASSCLSLLRQPLTGSPPLAARLRPVDGKWDKNKHRAVVVQTVTWFTLVHDAFQITISSVATASQVDLRSPPSICHSRDPKPWLTPCCCLHSFNLNLRPSFNFNLFQLQPTQVASNNYVRSAMFINTIEVSALVFVKLFNLLTWADTWKQLRGGRLKRVLTACGTMVQGWTGTKKEYPKALTTATEAADDEAV